MAAIVKESFVQVGPFLCDPELKDAVELFVSCCSVDLPQTHVRASTDVVLAQYHSKIQTIYIQKGYGDDEKSPLYKTAKKTWLFVMEVCNAVFCSRYESVIRSATNIEAYVEGMEFVEFEIVQKASTLIKEIKKKRPELEGCRQIHCFSDFRRYYLVQQLMGHSERYAARYRALHDEEDKTLYRGTWKHPIKTDEERQCLHVFQQLVFQNETSAIRELLIVWKGKGEPYRTIYENAKAFLSPSPETVLCSGKTAAHEQERPNPWSYDHLQWFGRNFFQVFL